ncbi:MAG TPA: TrbI/VirB10 family protein [Stellaceae bacterium]|nr:TrbI/VirB10 family protein [Stellaceae bacterium]
MTPPDPPEISKDTNPELLALRTQPRRVVRFKRHVVIGLAAVACVTVFAATWVALYGPALRRAATPTELYTTSRKQTPDALAGLPKSYDQLHPPPKLGAPLPGDLGPPVVQQEQRLDLRPNPEADAAQAERMRLAQQARRAREAGVFFALNRASGAPHPAIPTASGTTNPAQITGATIAAPTGSERIAFSARDPNDQQRKLDFLKAEPERAIYNPHSLQHPVSPYEVLAGTVISASLITGINSDLPGQALAQVTENVYDTVTGRILLIPQGSRLIGTYDSVVAFGQSRVLVVWQRIVMPDGSSIEIDNLPATDAAGYAGLSDEVDYHTWTLLKGVALSTLLGVGTEDTFGSAQSNLVQTIRESTQEGTNQAGQKIVEKNLNIQPTITVRPGWPVRVVVHKDLVLQPYRG